MTPEIQAFIDAAQSLGMWAIFFWLYINKEREIKELREKKDAEVERARAAHMNDLRDWSRLGQGLYSVGSPQNPAVPRDPRDFIPQPLPPANLP